MDLIAATGLVILLKLDSNHRFVSQYDFEIWWMTSKTNRPCVVTVWKHTIRVKIGNFLSLGKNRAPLLFHVKLCASFQCNVWIQTGVTVRKRSIRVKIGDFFVPWDLEYRQMSLKKWHLFNTASSSVHRFKTMGEFKLELQSNSTIFSRGRMTVKNNRTLF